MQLMDNVQVFMALGAYFEKINDDSKAMLIYSEGLKEYPRNFAMRNEFTRIAYRDAVSHKQTPIAASVEPMMFGPLIDILLNEKNLVPDEWELLTKLVKSSRVALPDIQKIRDFLVQKGKMPPLKPILRGQDDDLGEFLLNLFDSQA